MIADTFYIGVNTSKFEKRSNRKAVGTELLRCFSVIATNGDTLDLQAGTDEQCASWVFCLDQLRRRSSNRNG